MKRFHFPFLAAGWTSLRIFTVALLLWTCPFLAFLAANAQSNWPRWRGSQDNGSTLDGSYPVKWSADNVLWKAPLPGKGCSTPIVWNRRIYLTAPVEGQDAVLAFDWDGHELWRATFGPQVAGKHRNGSGSNASPVTDGQSVFVYFKSGVLAALDLDGTIRWQTNLVSLYGQETLFWDHGTSPVLTKDAVIMTRMHHGDSWLIAFDKMTGRMRWKADRNFETPVEGDQSYATPVVMKDADQEVVVVWGAEHVTAHGAADGKLIWSCGGFNPEARGYLPSVASALPVGDVLVVPHGRADQGKARVYGIKLGGHGDVNESRRLWKRDDGGAFVPTPAEYRGLVYFVQDRGNVTCLDPASGKTVWTAAFPRASSSYYASPVLADGKLYAAREDGAIFVAGVEKGFELLAENDMKDRVIACPVPVANRLLIRGESHLYCVGTAEQRARSE
jgi:outer membrane protein assembly factor BamB